MVSRFDDFQPEPDPSPEKLESPQQETGKFFTVMVPVFVKVKIFANDDLEAEVKAGQLLRCLSSLECSEGSSVTFQSVITPMAQ